MQATAIVMRYPLGQDLPQMPFIPRNDVVETLSTRRPDQTLAERVRLRRADRCFQDAKSHRSQCVVNNARERGIAIVHDKPVRFCEKEYRERIVDAATGPGSDMSRLRIRPNVLVERSEYLERFFCRRSVS